MRAKPKTVRLTWELAEVIAAIDGARVLAENLADDQLESEAQAKLALPAVAATLALVGQRLHLICRVLRAEVDAEALWAPHNAGPGDLLEGEVDVLLAGRSAGAWRRLRAR